LPDKSFIGCTCSFIAGYVYGGRYAGVYTLTFESAEQCSSASAGISASMAGVASGGAAFGDAMQQYKDRCSISRKVCATGWSASQLPQIENKTPEQLHSCMLEAAQAIDTRSGACLEALLCSYDGVAGYQEALAQ
jgi:hypothetical protein